MLNVVEERIVRPVFFDLSDSQDLEALAKLKGEGRVWRESDQIRTQISELIKLRNPSIKRDAAGLEAEVDTHLGDQKPEEYGVWVWYPWSGELVHLLPEKEFIEVRTNRNRNKINSEEQEKLAEFSIGVIGLSVGQSVCLTLAMQRGFGELRIADFDSLELSNLNRIRSGVSELGLSKVAITAREIAEIDPFLRVKCFWDGVNEDNLHEFLIGESKLDLLIDECDDLKIKVMTRIQARKLKIPVVMETSDRGMLDIERFDQETDLKLFHGRVGSDEEIRQLLNTNPIALATSIMNLSAVSRRGLESFQEMGKTLSAWPQLAEDVILGGATASKVARSICLNEPIKSGRYYIDVNEIISSS